MKQVSIPIEVQGYIAELHDQIQMLSERAAVKTAEVYALRREIERLKNTGHRSEQDPVEPDCAGECGGGQYMRQPGRSS